MAKIVFQYKQCYLGTYESIEAEAGVRKKAEGLLKEKRVGFYERWSKKRLLILFGRRIIL